MLYGYFQADRFDTDLQRFAVVILLPDAIGGYMTPLRERFDPDYGVIAPHITIVAPFETDAPLSEITGVLSEETSQMAPLLINLTSVGDYYPDFPLIYWQVQGGEMLDQLYKNLHAKLDMPLPYKRFHPHATVAREISDHRVVMVKDTICSYLPQESFTAPAVDLVSPVANQKWVSVRTFPFRGLEL